MLKYFVRVVAMESILSNSSMIWQLGMGATAL